MADLIIQSSPRPGVALLQLNRPEARNALDINLRRALAARIDALATDPAVRVVVMTGDEKAFAAGADLKAIAQATPLEMIESGLHLVWLSLARFPKPLVCAVRGVAVGAGCELAMTGDIVVVGEKALLGQPEIKVGLMPGAGGVQRLIRLVGRTRAMRLLLTGELISGRTAFEWGLASDVIDDAQVLDKALGYASVIADLPELSARQIKEVALAGADMSLDAALALERKAFWLLFGTADQREGIAAFLEKRPPAFNALCDD
jgi:enoyl-CoA hydratase